MSRIREVLRTKGFEVTTIEPEATVFAAIEKMVAHNIGALVVTQAGEVKGIISERDYMRRIALEGRSSRTTAVAEVMTRDIACIDPETSVEEAMAIMTKQRCRHLPVIESGALAGIVSVGDLVKHVAKDREAHIHFLTDYISGKYPA